MKKSNAWLAILFLCLAPLTVASAQGHGFGEGGFLGGFRRATLDDLDLFESQRQQVHPIVPSNHATFPEPVKAVLAAHRKLQPAIQPHSPLESTIPARTWQP